AEPEGRVRCARDERIERREVEAVRRVGHRTLTRICRVQPAEAVLVAEELHDRAALPQGAPRQPLAFEERRQARRVLREEVAVALVAPDVDLVEVQPGGADEDPRGEVVDARLQDAEGVLCHGSSLVSTGSWASGRSRAIRATA